jgi:AraC family transcriptional regulator
MIAGWGYNMLKVKVKKTKPMRIAFMEHKGDYGQVPFDQYFTKLFSWAKANKAKPGFKTMGIYFDNPDKTPPQECRCEVALPIYGDPPSGEEVKVKELDGMEVVSTKVAAPADDYPRIYHLIGDWMDRNGYDWAGPSYEIYTKKPKVKGNQTIMYSEIQVPIKKK